MNFASTSTADEMDRLHPEAVALALAFEAWSEKEGLPSVFVTDISRTLDWYAKNDLPPQPNSWHLFGCAVDFRTKHYTPDELARVVEWFRVRCADATHWELITKLHGSGVHLHVARRDHAWKAKPRGSTT